MFVNPSLSLCYRHEKFKFEFSDLGKKHDQVLVENQRLEDQLREEKFLTQEAEEIRNLLSQNKSDLETELQVRIIIIHVLHAFPAYAL